MITNARIITRTADPSEYHHEVCERGDPKFTIGSGTLRSIAQCPRRWRWGYEPPDSESKDFGSLLDCRFLTPDQFQDRYAVHPDKYDASGMQCPKCKSVTTSQKCKKCGLARVPITVEKNWNGNATECAEWLEEHKDKEIVSKTDVDAADLAVKRLYRDPVIRAFVEASEKQVWLEAQWLDKATGILVPIKCLIDLLPRKDTEFAACLGDLKSSRNVGIHQWGRFAYQMGYHLQGALYTDVYQAATNEGRESFCWVICENYRPFETAKRLCSQDLLAVGRLEYQNALALYARCLKDNDWPGYDELNSGAVQGWSLVDAPIWVLENALKQRAELTKVPDSELPTVEDVQEIYQKVNNGEGEYAAREGESEYQAETGDIVP